MWNTVNFIYPSIFSAVYLAEEEEGDEVGEGEEAVLWSGVFFSFRLETKRRLASCQTGACMCHRAGFIEPFFIFISAGLCRRRIEAAQIIMKHLDEMATNRMNEAVTSYIDLILLVIQQQQAEAESS